MSGFSFKINYNGSSKVIKRIVEKLNSVAVLGTQHDQAYFGDLGQTAYEHSQETGNAHDLTLADLGIENLLGQIQLALEAIGAVDEWGDYELDDEEEQFLFYDHDGDQLMFRSNSDLLAWH